MEEKLQALIGNAKQALKDLQRELPFISVSYDIIKDRYDVFLRDYRHLNRIEGQLTFRQLDTSWKVSKVCNGIEFFALVDSWEVAGRVKHLP